jgi:SOS-response transcriptional repressor LexA
VNGPAQVYPPSPVRAGLTGRQRDCFEAIVLHIAVFRQPPTIRELAKAMGLVSKGRIHNLLVGLQERGWITFIPKRARTIAIVTEAPSYKLPPDVEAALLKHCCATGENPADVLADAVTMLLDDVEGDEDLAA